MVQTVTSPPVPLAARMDRVRSSAIRELLAHAEQPGVISLAGGMPAPETFPVGAIAAALAAVLAEASPGALQYSMTEGIAMLRAWIAEQHSGTHRPAALDQVLVTHGSQQALDLVARATVDPGTVVALADPGYIGAIGAFRLAGARLAAIPSDRDGLVVDALAERLSEGLRPALVYVVANFDNPTGATLSRSRRRALAALADRFGFLIVDDDPYGHLRWAGDAIPGLARWSERVVSLGTISKLVAPGLRVGYAVGPAELIRAMVLLKQATDLHTGTLAQHVALRLLAEPGFVAEQADRLRPVYRHRAEVLAAALRAELGEAVRFRDPEGGMFIWASIDGPGVDTARLLPAAIGRGVAYVPGSAFGIEAAHRAELRLSFATAGPDELRRAAARLAEVLSGPWAGEHSTR